MGIRAVGSLRRRWNGRRRLRRFGRDERWESARGTDADACGGWRLRDERWKSVLATTPRLAVKRKGHPVEGDRLTASRSGLPPVIYPWAFARRQSAERLRGTDADACGGWRLRDERWESVLATTSSGSAVKRKGHPVEGDRLTASRSGLPPVIYPWAFGLSAVCGGACVERTPTPAEVGGYVMNDGRACWRQPPPAQPLNEWATQSEAICCARVSRPRTTPDRRSPRATICANTGRPPVAPTAGSGDPRRARNAPRSIP